MGVITNLIRTGMEKKQQDQYNQMQAFTLASKSDDPQLRQWGIQSLVDMGKKTVMDPEQKKHLPVIGHIAQVLGALNPMPKAATAPEGPAPVYSPERAKAERANRAEEETQLALKRSKLMKEQENDLALAQTKAVEKAKLDIDDLVYAKRRGEAKQRLEGIKNLLSPDEYKRILVNIDTDVTLPTAAAPKQTNLELKDGTVIPAWESSRPGTFETLDHRLIDPATIRAVGVAIEPKYSGELKTRMDAQKILNDPKSTPAEVTSAKATIKSLDERARGVTIRNMIGTEQSGAGGTPDIKQGTHEFRVAQDLAYGKLTLQQFRILYAYSRDANKRTAIYAKARELNPNFNPAAFEMGFTLAKNPRVQQQLASMDNVQQAVPDLLRFSDEASRTGVTVLNKAVRKGGYALGGKTYSNLHVASVAFADELSGALGFGNATDMSRQMGFDMTDPDLSPENLRSGIQDVVIPFIERKRNTLLHQMGTYGQPGVNPAAGTESPEPTPAPSGRKPPLSEIFR